MPIANVKVYLDGSHPIAIPPQAYPPPKRKRKKKQYLKKVPVQQDNHPPSDEREIENDKVAKYAENRAENGDEVKFITVDLKEVFDNLYDKYKDKKNADKRREIVQALRPYFENEKEARAFVDIQLERKKRNYIVRMTRLYRKVYGNDFNYFCTMT